MNLRELLERRARLVAEARQLLDTASAANRDLTAEESLAYDARMAEVTSLGAQIERAQRLQAIEADLQRSLSDPNRPDPQPAQPGQPGQPGQEAPENRAQAGRASDEYRQAFGNWLRGGVNGLSGHEVRALQVDNDTLGGYLVTPESFVNALIRAVDDLVYMRQWATVYPVPTADSLGVPSLDADPADASWTTELGTGTEDSTMSFGKRSLHPHPLAKSIRISRTLLARMPDAEALVLSRLAYKFAITEEKGFLTGTGAQQPLGVFVASADGITTARDVSTGNTATSITFDGLTEAKYTLKPQYWPRARWLFHRDAMKQIAKLKDGEGQYIWRETVRVGEPDNVLGLPVFMSEYAPNTFTASQYVGILGDFSNYWIADSLRMEIQRLVELYAASNQVGLIGRLECDGMPVLAEAFVRVKLSA
jgi:HK97 family phage major capsid protein